MNLPVAISKNSVLLLSFALITAGILALTYERTKGTIEAAERKAAEKALLEIIPADRIDNDLLLDTLPVPPEAWRQLGLEEGGNLHIARRHKKIIAVIVPTIALDGYSGTIKMIAGINRDGTVAGVRVLSHRETPGLGDKIDLKKSEWIKSFNGRSLASPTPDRWKVKKDGGEFDQFTGATITPRAVVTQIARTLNFVRTYEADLFNGNHTHHQSEKP